MMQSKVGFGNRIDASLERALAMPQKFIIRSIWDVDQIRRVRHGYLYEDRLINRSISQNVCTDEGLNALIDIMFHGSTQITTWYVLIFETDTTPSGSTTYATPVFTESQAYDEATRQAFVESAASSKSCSNTANKATFTISATKTIYGGALVGGGSAATTKADTAGGGTMYCASKFTSAKSCVDDDVLRVTVTLTAADT